MASSGPSNLRLRISAVRPAVLRCFLYIRTSMWSRGDRDGAFGILRPCHTPLTVRARYVCPQKPATSLQLTSKNAHCLRGCFSFSFENFLCPSASLGMNNLLLSDIRRWFTYNWRRVSRRVCEVRYCLNLSKGGHNSMDTTTSYSCNLFWINVKC